MRVQDELIIAVVINEMSLSDLYATDICIWSLKQLIENERGKKIGLKNTVKIFKFGLKITVVRE